MIIHLASGGQKTHIQITIIAVHSPVNTVLKLLHNVILTWSNCSQILEVIFSQEQNPSINSQSSLFDYICAVVQHSRLCMHGVHRTLKLLWNIFIPYSMPSTSRSHCTWPLKKLLIFSYTPPCNQLFIPSVQKNLNALCSINWTPSITRAPHEVLLPYVMTCYIYIYICFVNTYLVRSFD